MNKFTTIYSKNKDEIESKKLPNLINKSKLALDNYVNNVQLTIIDKEAKLEEIEYDFVKGDMSSIKDILTMKSDIKLLKEEVNLVEAYKKEMFDEVEE